MKYMLLLFASEAAQQAASKADTDQMHAAYGAYTQAMIKAGVMGGGERLKPSTSATTVRISGGKTKVVNGPYAESKEQLGGYYIVEAANLDEALKIAHRIPSVRYGGAIEVRPIMEIPRG
jgi:hypothetical protein